MSILHMAQSGVWRGVVGTRQGKFRFEHVEVITDTTDPVTETSDTSSKGHHGHQALFYGQKDMPTSVEDLLSKIGLQVSDGAAFTIAVVHY